MPPCGLVRRQGLLLALLLLPLTMPAASAATGPATDAEVILESDGTVRLVEIVTEDSRHYSPYNWPVHKGYTFREARDAAGVLPTRVEGDTIRIETRGRGASYSFQVIQVASAGTGPFVQLDAPVAAREGDATSVRARVPSGWRIVGWQASGMEPDAYGVFRGSGPLHVSYLAARNETPVAAPDARVSGDVVLREAWADISREATLLTLRVTYDTDTFGPEWTLLSPDNATLVNASTPLGPLAAATVAGEVELTAPYPFAYHLGAQPFTVTWRLPPPEPFGGGFVESDLSIPAAPQDLVRLEATLASGLTFVGHSLASGNATGPLSFAGRGPLRAEVHALPPPGPGETRFEEGAYVVQAPAELAGAARAVARNASELLPIVARHVGGDRVDRPFFVLYTHADVFQWEEGFYSTGANAITIRASDLANATATEPDLRSVQTLVHETTHGLLDRLMPGRGVDLAFFDEGLSRLAETHVERFFPDDIVVCESSRTRQSCSVRSARPESAIVEERYTRSLPFPVQWSTATAGEARGDLYDLSGLVFHAYETRTPPGTLVEAVSAIAATMRASEKLTDAERAELVLSTLEARSGLSRDNILHPGRPLAGTSAFRPCMAFLVAPPYPWETVAARGAQCGSFWPSETNATGGSFESPAAPAPYVDETAPPTPPSGSVWTPLPADELGLPDPGAQAPAGGSSTSTGDDASGALLDDEALVVPGFGAFLVLAAVGAALAMRRYR